MTSSDSSSLPIFEVADDLRSALREKYARIVVEAPTGSGKSTQIPQFIADSELGQTGEIYVLQPRRIAARMLASRVARERNGRLGDEVGYQVRFEASVSANTRIRYVTEGILIRRLVDDPTLRGISAVVLDEFHERHFFGDISLSRCLEVQKKHRPDLAIVVMSATLESENLIQFFQGECTHLRSEGRTFPVAISYQPPKERHKGELWDHIARTLKEHFSKNGVEGHTLIFLPGRHEIRKTADTLSRAPWSKGFEIHELYGELSPEKQDAAVATGSGVPRIIISTNVAETSLTIDGVRLVVDSGLERRSAFDPRRGITTLHIEKISQASADQRAGRAGRTGPGVAIRLWSERDHQQRLPAIPPEIKRMDLAEAILILQASGVENIADFHWFEEPEPADLKIAQDWLRELGACDAQNALTPLGKKLGKIPIHPRFGRVLLAAAEEGDGCLEFTSVAMAILQSRPLFPRQKLRSEHLTAEPRSEI